MSKRITQARPSYIENGEPGQPPRYLIDLPWSTTSGHEASPFEYNNGAHAAVHSILAALRCNKKKDVTSWLTDAKRQIDDAVKALAKPYARIVPAPETEPVYWPRVPGDLDAVLKKGGAMKKPKLIPITAQSVIDLAGAAATLSGARAAVNKFAATSKDPAGRTLLALAIGAHLVAMRRLQVQLEAPVAKTVSKKRRKKP